MEITFVWSWFSFWIGAVATLGLSVVAVFGIAIKQYVSKNKKQRRF